MRLTAIVVLAAGCMTAAGAAADPAEDALRARRGFFTMLGLEIAPLAGMARGEVAYDADIATRHAANLRALSGYGFTALFPDGTSNEEMRGQTRAMADIWLDNDDFRAKAAGFVEAVGRLDAAAGAGRAELGGAVGALAAACKACHDSYRAKDF